MLIDQDKLYTAKEVSSILGMSVVTIKRRIADKHIPSVKFGGARRIKGSDLADFQTSFFQKGLSNTRGCFLHYSGKLETEQVIRNTESANIKLIERVGKAKSGNSLISGDNLSVLKALYDDKEYRGRIDLVYIDPPFGTGQDFVGYDDKLHYSDRLINSEYLEFLRRRLILLRELLSKSGSIYLHIDQKIGHYVKILLDEVFGHDCFRNDITRIKCNPKNFERKAFGNMKDVIYFYSKSPVRTSDSMLWNDYRVPLTGEELDRQYPKVDSSGRRYSTTPLHAKGETRNGPTGMPWKGMKPPKGRHWRYAPTELTRLDNMGLIEWSQTGNPRKINYADESKGKKIQDIWDFRDPGFEKSSYPTEKSLDLLKQIILSSTRKGGLVLDCFAGSGTTLLAAESLERKWIGVDSNPAAIQVARDRILKTNAAASFTINDASNHHTTKNG